MQLAAKNLDKFHAFSEDNHIQIKFQDFTIFMCI